MSLHSGKLLFGMSGYQEGSATAGSTVVTISEECREPTVSLTETDAKLAIVNLDIPFLASASRITTTCRYTCTATP